VTIAYIGLGSNLAEPQSQVEQALSELEALPRTRVVDRSSLYRTAPVGFAAQPDFVNAVAAVETSLNAHELLHALQALEAAHQRRRSFANAPRTLDLDLLLFGDERIADAELVVPHPRMHERAFVLAPLAEVAPDALIPGRGAARDLLERCRDQKVERIAP
jgi:2-amino-4-hydroxy-6-hydroxymethyldihydropteridine diphosphokinase